MTFDATSALVAASYELVRPRTVARPEVRWMFAHAEFRKALAGGLPHFPDARADALVTRYAAGHAMFVSLSGTPRVGSHPDFERLRNLDECWVFCMRRPRPGWRLFGRFVRKDVFVGVQLVDRHVLGRAETYERYARRALERWDNDVPFEPLRGERIEDYLGGVTVDADKDIFS